MHVDHLDEAREQGIATGTQFIILLHGSNLLRDGLELRHRLSPGALQALRAVEQYSPTQLSELQVSYLVDQKVRMRTSQASSYPLFIWD